MSHLGILLACEHYPAVSGHRPLRDAQLRFWLKALGYDPRVIRVYRCYEGDFPSATEKADAWIVSGAPLVLTAEDKINENKLTFFVRSAKVAGRPVLGIYHGEHVLHRALTRFDAPAPATRVTPDSIRNPFSSFWQSDRIFRFCPLAGRIVEERRPREMQKQTIFGARSVFA